MRKPDLSGHAQAWIAPIPEKNPDGSLHATIRHWLVKGGFHAFWDHWIVSVVHLREEPGLSKPHKSAANMTHEFMIFVLDPGQEKAMRDYDPDNLPSPLPYLTPIDCAVQFEARSDAHALEICDLAVKDIIAGNASPDQDYRSYWQKVIPATAACRKHKGDELQ